MIAAVEHDAEYLSWSEEARYRYEERMGMLFGDTPFEQCDPDLVESAREVARAYAISERKQKQKAEQAC